MMIPSATTHTQSMSSLPSRIAAALAVPWQTSYTAPTLMALSGVAYALRGYEVRWSEPSMRRDRDGAYREPASISYACFQIQHGERFKTHGVGLTCIFPSALVLAEWRLRARAEVATRRQADGRIDEILGLLRRIAAELGVTS